MVLNDARTLAGRLCLSGPLLYIGLTMALDPAGFMASARTLAGVLRTFEQRWRGVVWLEPMEWAPVSRSTLIAVRLTGWVIAAGALLPLTGLAG